MKMLLSFICLFLVASCSTKPSKFYQEYVVTCSQTPEMREEGKEECVRLNNDRDLYKWHKVKAYQTLGDMPDLD